MKKILLLLPFLLLANSCSGNKEKIVLTIDAPYTIISELKDSYSLNETVTIQLAPKPYFALPKKDQITVEYGGNDFSYSEDTGLLKIKLIANTIISIDADLGLGQNIEYAEWDRWCSKRETEEDRTFESISVSWDFIDDGGSSTLVKTNLNMDLVPFLLLQKGEWPGIPEFLTDLTGTFTHQWIEEETIPSGRNFLMPRSDLSSINNKYSIYDKQSIVSTNAFDVVAKSKDVPSITGNAIIFFNENVMLSKLVVMLDDFYSPYAGDGPLNGTLEFNYVY